MKDDERLWTIDELTDAVGEALAEGYDGASNGRVRDVPDRRTIRYYTTLGLIDRPAEMRGRTALYGRRHLLQIVAIKKLQALGRSLAEIQHALTGQTDKELARLAGQDARSEESSSAEPGRRRPGRDFWRQEPDAYASSSSPTSDEEIMEGPLTAVSSAVDRPQALLGVRLRDGVTLLLAPSRPIQDEDLALIRSAAAPLIDTLTRSRLIDPREGGDPS
jgi:DNA-binding transcriptional MerR regulator